MISSPLFGRVVAHRRDVPDRDVKDLHGPLRRAEPNMTNRQVKLAHYWPEASRPIGETPHCRAHRTGEDDPGCVQAAMTEAEDGAGWRADALRRGRNDRPTSIAAAIPRASTACSRPSVAAAHAAKRPTSTGPSWDGCPEANATWTFLPISRSNGLRHWRLTMGGLEVRPPSAGTLAVGCSTRTSPPAASAKTATARSSQRHQSCTAPRYGTASR